MSDEQGRVTPGWLARSALFVLWALVAWGGLLLLAALAEAANDGLLPALARLLPAPGISAWGWLNSLSAALALAVGVVAAGLFLWGRLVRSASESEHPGD